MSIDPLFVTLRREEFGRLDREGCAYLDYTGAALYAQSQIEAQSARLASGVFGNPHSAHAPSLTSTHAIDEARMRVLSFLDADPSIYTVCFTANATAAVKLVAESYPFGPRRGLVLTVDNHNSMNGIREYARRAGAPVRHIPVDDDLRLCGPGAVLADAASHDGPGLFGMPAQSNFSGVRHPLSLVDEARALGYDVLLDAAAYAPSSPLSLRACPADFVTLSFYKLFGLPTTAGALVGRRNALDRLVRPWFAGGTVLYVSVSGDRHRLRPAPEGFEDGTPGFLEIAALAPGFDLLERVGLPRLSAHVSRLTALALEGLLSLRHGNGKPMVRLYGPATTKARGGTLAFNVCDASGREIPFAHVESFARSRGVALRGGCFCNPGAAEAAFGLSEAIVHGCLDHLGEAFTIEAFTECAGRPVGAMRLSVGLANNDEDVRRAVEAIAACAREHAAVLAAPDGTASM